MGTFEVEKSVGQDPGRGNNMNASAHPEPKTIRTEIKKEGGLYTATSPDIKGFIAANTDYEKLLREQIPYHIQQLFAHSGVHVEVTPLEAVDVHDQSKASISWQARRRDEAAPRDVTQG